jgi:purine-binding chemotaxis protein CheW
MDFLEIRKKAKDRAQARVAGEATSAPKPAPAPVDPAPSAPASEPVPERPAEGMFTRVTPPADAPVLTDDDVLVGALAARLQGLPEAAPAPEAAPQEGAFRTWRPGSGAPPFLPPELAPSPETRASPETDHARIDRELEAPAPVAPQRAPAAAPPHATAARSRAPAPAAGPAPAAPLSDPLDEFFFRDDEAGPVLGELAAADALPDAPAPVLEREEFLTFLLGAEEFAVAIQRVREVVRSPPVTEVPRAPRHILGVVTVRGEVVAVIDPRRRLGLASADEADEGKIVILDAGEGPAGLKVDRIASVVRLRPGSIEPCPQGIAGDRGEFIAGIGREGDRLFTVLDVPALLRRAPARVDVLPRRPDAGV